MKDGTVQVEGVDYHWSVYRQPRWTGDGVLLGLALLVKPVKSSRRELILEFAIDPTGRGEMPQIQRLQVPKRRLIECIQNALNAGWDPESRGKGFFFSAGAVNPK
ncbi:MAG TPA: hypothetical protein VGO67_18325 [Verrucomicrobiae bacterium]|jgi:hypothetical protein